MTKCSDLSLLVLVYVNTSCTAGFCQGTGYSPVPYIQVVQCDPGAAGGGAVPAVVAVGATPARRTAVRGSGSRLQRAALPVTMMYPTH